MDILIFVRELLSRIWWFFAEHFWADFETLWKPANRTKYWHVGWTINAILTYSAIMVTKGFANQSWLGLEWLALLLGLNCAAAICTVAFFGKQYRLIVFVGHWAWVVWTSGMVVLILYIISLFIR